MKSKKIIQWLALSWAMSVLSAQAAFLNLGQDPSSPYYADFTASGLSVNYAYNSATGIGTFTATDSGNRLAYTDGSLSPGTQGQYKSTGFNGSYSLTAYIENVGGTWEVLDDASHQSTLTVKGNLLGGTTSDVLLSANLKSGANTFGYGASGSTIFDFLFTVSGGESSIVQDYFGANQGQGAIILNVGSYYNFPPGGYLPYSGDLTKNFETNPSNPTGSADTFVPEPVAYPWAMSTVALLCAAGFVRRNLSVSIT